MIKKNNIKKKYKLKTGDDVQVISGNYKGKTGKITSVVTKKGRAFVSGINEVKKHVKPSAKYPRGGIIAKSASINISNLMYLDSKTTKRCRIGRKLDKDGKLQRYSKATGDFIS
ncbi:MAG: 50S ribosomal protein L24 [Bacteroidetes bacterium]|nr:50S ribosomal protein L24 [Bacteroidota bacterium]